MQMKFMQMRQMQLAFMYTAFDLVLTFIQKMKTLKAKRKTFFAATYEKHFSNVVYGIVAFFLLFEKYMAVRNNLYQ